MRRENSVFQISQGFLGVFFFRIELLLPQFSTVSLEMASSILLATGLELKRETAKEGQMTGYIGRCCWNEI